MKSFETQDDISVRPWACIGLQSLTICIENVKQEWSEQGFGHISKSTKLPYLNVSQFVLQDSHPWMVDSFSS